MAADLIVEPSCDIHVVLDGAVPRPKIAVFRRDFSAAFGTPNTLTPVTTQCEFDFFDPESRDVPPRRFVNIAPVDGRITPVAAGTNLVQVRLSHAGKNLYIIVRIQVHQRLDGWWFGDDTLPVVHHDSIAHSKVSIYALFDFDAARPELTVPGDITGHGYVALTSANATIAELDADGRGRVKGKTVGNTRITGTLLGRSQDLDVEVVDVYNTNRVAKRVRGSGPAEDRFNILFLSEGYADTDADRNAFDSAVEGITKRLFEARRHSPFRLVQSAFNVWKRFEPSGQRGITTGFEVTKGGYPIPFTQKAIPQFYGLHELVARVGLPRPVDTLPEASAAALKNRWRNQHLAGYQEFRVHDAVVEGQWKISRPLTFPQTHRSFFGLHHGVRWGDRSSAEEPNRIPITEDDAEDTGVFPGPEGYQRRMYEWFTPALPTRMAGPDPRRHPPELNYYDDYIVRYMARLIDTTVPIGDPGRAVGEQWAPRAGVPRPKSLGLVAILINDEGGAGVMLFGTYVSVTTSDSQRLGGIEDSEIISGGLRTRLRRRTPPNKSSLDSAVDTMAHEFGHAFNLGDEYEFIGGTIRLPPAPPPFPLPFRANRDPRVYDNLDYITSIAQPTLPVPVPEAPPIVPSALKWKDCNRMALSDAIVAPSVTVGGSMRLQLGFGRARRWTKVMAEGKDVVVRALYITSQNTQLPIVHRDPDTGVHRFVAGLKIEGFDLDADTVTVGGPQMPIPVPPMVKGSVLFLPRLNKAGDLLFLIEKPVMSHMTSTRLPLTSNFIFDPASGFCANLQSSADNPPNGIAGFHYPSHRYQVLGAYEGGNEYTCGVYRASGACKMRAHDGHKAEGEFCFLCKYLLVNRIDATEHDRVDLEYPEDC